MTSDTFKAQWREHLEELRDGECVRLCSPHVPCAEAGAWIRDFFTAGFLETEVPQVVMLSGELPVPLAMGELYLAMRPLEQQALGNTAQGIGHLVRDALQIRRAPLVLVVLGVASSAQLEAWDFWLPASPVLLWAISERELTLSAPWKRVSLSSMPASPVEPVVSPWGWFAPWVPITPEAWTALGAEPGEPQVASALDRWGEPCAMVVASMQGSPSSRGRFLAWAADVLSTAPDWKTRALAPHLWRAARTCLDGHVDDEVDVVGAVLLEMLRWCRRNALVEEADELWVESTAWARGCGVPRWRLVLLMERVHVDVLAGRWGQAQRGLEELLRSTLEPLGERHVVTHHLSARLCQARRHQGDWAGARDAAQDALLQAVQSHGEVSEASAQSAYILAELQALLGDLDSAAQAFHLASQVYESLLGGEALQAREARARYLDTLEALMVRVG